jgi:hypothetical protein
LRANIVRIISESDYDSPIDSVNKIANNFSETQDGKIVLFLIKDLLLKLNLRQSLSAFEAEIGLEVKCSFYYFIINNKMQNDCIKWFFIKAKKLS